MLTAQDDVQHLRQADLALPRRGSLRALGGGGVVTPVIVFTAPTPSYIATCFNAGAVASGGQVLDVRIVFTQRVVAGTSYADAQANGKAADWGRAVVEPTEVSEIEALTLAAELAGDVPRLLLRTGRYAYYVGAGAGGSLRFGYVVSSDDVSTAIDGYLSASSTYALELGTWRVISESGYLAVASIPLAAVFVFYGLEEACGQDAISVAIPMTDTASFYDTDIDYLKTLMQQNGLVPLTVDTSAPSVVAVFADEPSQWCSELATRAVTCGAGEEISVYVEFEHTVVVASGSATLLLNSGECAVERDADYQTCAGGVAVWDASVTPSTTLRFVYTVAEGDAAFALDVLNTTAFTGDVRRYSTPSSTRAAILTLPAPGAATSISRHSKIGIDTSRPTVVALFPLKRAGTYVAGELVYVVARFSSAVVAAADTAAAFAPRLSLDASVDAYARLVNGTLATQPFDVGQIADYDLPFRPTVCDLLFEYRVAPGDATDSLKHSGRGALYVMSNATNVLFIKGHRALFTLLLRGFGTFFESQR